MANTGITALQELPLLMFDDLARLQLTNNNIGLLLDGKLMPKSLQELRLVRCNIENMTNVIHLVRLMTLYLQHNRLTFLPDLSQLPLNSLGLKRAGEKTQPNRIDVVITWKHFPHNSQRLGYAAEKVQFPVIRAS